MNLQKNETSLINVVICVLYTDINPVSYTHLTLPTTAEV